MTVLYHGGETIIRQPEIRKPNRTLDFGYGFYLTSSRKQAEDWVNRKLELQAFAKGFVNQYAFSFEVAEKMLNIKKFDGPTVEWLDFVMSNRRIREFDHDYDIVIGPVANDRVYTAFALFEGGSISKSTLIAELKTYRLIDQYLFHTDEALKFLTFQQAFEIIPRV